MHRVTINSGIIRWGIERSGLTAELLEGKFPKLQDWLVGNNFPTLKQLQDFAKKVKLPIGYFFLSEPPEEKLPIPYFRTVNTAIHENPSPELIDTLYAMQRRQLWLREYMLETGSEKLGCIGAAKITDAVESVAASIRYYLGLTEGWAQEHPNWESALRHLYHSTDEAGINVVTNGIVGNNTHRTLNPHEFRGFVLVDNYAPILFVNNADGKAAQMFTIAHELAHLWFGASAIFDLAQLQPADNETEIACNKVAAEFLVPASSLRNARNSVKDINNAYQVLAKRYKVSEIVVARRLLDLRLISKAMFFKFYEAYQSEAEERDKTTSGGNYYNNQGFRVGHNFMRAVVQAVGERNLQHIDAFRLTSLYGKTFDEYARKVLGGN